MSKYIVTEKIESPARVNKFIEVKDFFFLLTWMGLNILLSKMFVHPNLTVPFYVFSFLVGFLLTSKSFINKGRRNYESIYLFLMKDFNVYKGIYNINIFNK